MIPHIHPVLHLEPTIPPPILPGGLPNAVAWMKQQLAAVLDAFSRKQDTLQSGVNLKTINGESLLGAGDLKIAGAEAAVKSATVNGGTKVTPDENGNLALSVDTTSPPLYLHYRVVNSVPGLYSRKMVGGTAIYTLETFASISSQINGRVVECWLAYDDDPTKFSEEETTDRYSRFKLTTASTSLLTFDITGQYAGRMYSRRIKIDNNNVVELGTRFEMQNAASALTKTNGAVLKDYLAESVKMSLGKADTASQPGHKHATADITDLGSWVNGLGFLKKTWAELMAAFAEKSHSHELSEINATKFPPESHSHVKTDITDFPAIPEVVAPASDMAFSSDENKDKVPTCGSVGAALGRRLSTSGGTLTGDLIIKKESDISVILNQIIGADDEKLLMSYDGGLYIERFVNGNSVARHDFPREKTGNIVLDGDISKITAQDIADFVAKNKEFIARYKGKFKTANAPYSKGDIVYDIPNDWYVSLVDDNYDAAGSDGYWERIETPTQGFQKLLDLYEKNKTILFADTAFIEAVKEKVDATTETAIVKDDEGHLIVKAVNEDKTLGETKYVDMYRLNSTGVKDAAFNTIVPAANMALALPPKVDGHMRDFAIIFTIGAAIPENFSLPVVTFADFGDTAIELKVNTKFRITYTEIEADVFEVHVATKEVA